MDTGENKMGTMALGKLLFSMSVPIMISMFIQALYNMVDSIFVARISEDALAAVSLAFPIQNIMGALAVGLSVGVNATVPRYLGMKDHASAEKTANVSVFLSTCIILVFMLFGIFAVRPYYLAQTRDPGIVAAGRQYLSIVTIACFGCIYGLSFEKMLVGFGFTVRSMLSQIAGAVINILLDPILIFGLGPFPALGAAGAALATVFGQTVGAGMAFVYLTRKAVPIRLRARLMKPSRKVVKELLRIGIPSTLTIGLGSCMSFSMNQILLSFSKTATAVFGIWMRLQGFANMPIYGLNNGSIPILSYNYGARRLDRVNGTIYLSYKVGLPWMAFASSLFLAIPRQMLALFDASEQMLAIGVPALRIAGASLVFAGAIFIMNASFQALGHALYATVTNLCRHVLFIVPIAWSLSLTGNVDLVWLAIVITDILAMSVALPLRLRIKRELARKLLSSLPVPGADGGAV